MNAGTMPAKTSRHVSAPSPVNVALLSWMKARGLNGKALAARCGITPYSLSRLIRLRVKPTWETVALLETALGVSREKLGYGDLPSISPVGRRPGKRKAGPLQ